VTLDVPREDFDSDELWMSLTPDEARELARRLIRQAVTAEAAGRAVEPDDTPISVVPLADTTYELSVRGHRVIVDQPVEAGGADLGPPPIALFVGALAACVATYAGGYLARHGLDRRGLRVTCEYELAADRPARVSTVRLRIHLPDGVPDKRRAPLLAVARHCTAHNTLKDPPVVEIAFGEST